MKRVLCIISNMNAGGAETFLMKIYRKLEREKYQMDFCINVKEHCFYEDEINKLGGNIYRIPSKSEGIKIFSDELYKVVKNHGYKYVLRITSNAAGFYDLKIAKKAGAEVCVARSSNSSDGQGWKALSIHKICRILYGKYVDIKIAPSDLAAIYTFGKNSNVNILHNAIDLNVFKYNEEGRKTIRNFYRIKKTDILIGHVGRFMTQKNHTFLIDIFYQLYQKNNNYKLLLIGKGELEEILKTRINSLGLKDAVIFGGVRTDIPDILSAMDIFVFPSLYEGMPNTVIEAQAVGLPCLISNTITKEADITGLVKYLSLSNLNEWIQEIEKIAELKHVDTKYILKEKKYDIESQAKEFVRLVFENDVN